VQGRRVWKQGDSEIWVKPLTGGRRALLLFNRGEAPATISADWDHLGYPRQMKARIRDLWAHADLPRAKGSYSATIAPHAVQMLVVEP
jgi:alpha-galactosidase